MNRESYKSTTIAFFVPWIQDWLFLSFLTFLEIELYISESTES